MSSNTKIIHSNQKQKVINSAKKTIESLNRLNRNGYRYDETRNEMREFISNNLLVTIDKIEIFLNKLEKN